MLETHAKVSRIPSSRELQSFTSKNLILYQLLESAREFTSPESIFNHILCSQTGKGNLSRVLNPTKTAWALTPPLTFRVLCRARNVCAFSLMTGFLLRRMKDFLKWSCVNGCSWPIRETPPSFKLFIIVLISSSGPPSQGNVETERGAKWEQIKMEAQAEDGCN